jgi:alpha-L-fucosidase 2
LPALPSAWPDGHIKGLKARGDIVADIFWSEGVLEKAILYAPKGANKEIVYKNESVIIHIKAGDTYVFIPEKKRS